VSLRQHRSEKHPDAYVLEGEGYHPDLSAEGPIILKERQQGNFEWTNRSRTYANNGSLNSDHHTLIDAYHRKQWMQTVNHGIVWRYHAKWPQLDIGGSWLKYDVDVDIPGQYTKCWYKGFQQSHNDWDGNLFANPTTQAMLTHSLSGNPTADAGWFTGLCPPAASPAQMDQFGTSAIAAVAPTNPTTKLFTALGELYRDGLPALPGKDGNVGSEYLNLQFAWSPTISDGLSFLKAIRNHEAVQQQFLRDAGRPIRRSFHPSETVTTSVAVTTGAAPVSTGQSPTSLQVSLGKRTVTTVTTEKWWFEGVFVYFLDQHIFGRSIAELDRQYGIAPTTNGLWALTPWSWLFDWFSNAPEVLVNLSNFGQRGLVMRRGYAMRQITTEVTSTWEGFRADGGAVNVPLFIFDRYKVETKQRRRANPYGFGVAWDGLDAFQLSILAALGISRA